MIRALEPDKDYIIRSDKNGIVDDVVEVVRCKDCKYHKRVDWGMGDCKYPNGFKWIAYDNDFCSRGERKDEID